MSETLYPYYQRELLFIRQLAQEFAQQYPAAAARLQLEPNRSADPHVERLIEAFAFLSGRIHHKLDDEFPELTDALLGVLYPHYLAPVPSAAVVQFELDAERAALPKGFALAKGTRLRTPAVHGVPLRFRTAYPVTLWPVKLTTARLVPPPFPANLKPPAGTVAALRLQFEAQGGLRFSDLELDKLRLYLTGDSQVVASLYELLFTNVLQVAFRPVEGESHLRPLELNPDQCLSPVGFVRDEGLLPYSNRSFLGYRLLTEFFTFPEKFNFVDLGGWKQVAKAGFGRRTEVILFLKHTSKTLEQGIDTAVFRLGCTPVVNLFELTAEPIPLTETRFEYRVTPDVAHPLGMEVYSIDSVTATDPISRRVTAYQPFYSFRHGQGREERQTFWYASRRPSLRENDRGSETYLSLVDLGFNPHLPAEQTLIVRTTCTNRELPGHLQTGGTGVRFDLEGAAPLSSLRCLRAPTPTLRPPLRRGAYWRLLSHLNLNHLSLADPDEAKDALQEILRLYDFSDPGAGQQQLAAVTRQLIEGITKVKAKRTVGRVGEAASSGFCRGIEITIEFDEQKYVGTGVFLFASILERFLGLYASINSFTQLVAKTKQSDAPFKKWRPRAGEMKLI